MRQAKDEAAQFLAQAKADAQAKREEIVSSAQDDITDMMEKAAEKLMSKSTIQAYDQFLDSVEGSGRDE
jgi:vacuolar-type H+-ATPase subunit H